jgi:FAD/FMN-containing dehydrogenase
MKQGNFALGWFLIFLINYLINYTIPINAASSATSTKAKPVQKCKPPTSPYDKQLALYLYELWANRLETCSPGGDFIVNPSELSYSVPSFCSQPTSGGVTNYQITYSYMNCKPKKMTQLTLNARVKKCGESVTALEQPFNIKSIKKAVMPSNFKCPAGFTTYTGDYGDEDFTQKWTFAHGAENGFKYNLSQTAAGKNMVPCNSFLSTTLTKACVKASTGEYKGYALIAAECLNNDKEYRVPVYLDAKLLGPTPLDAFKKCPWPELLEGSYGYDPNFRFTQPNGPNIFSNPVATTAESDIPKALDCLKTKKISFLTVANGESFRKAKVIWNKLNDTNVPTAVVQPTTIAQVQDAVKCLSSNGVRAIVRGGGHSYEGYSLINNVATIDLRALNSLKISSDKKSATIGGGSHLGPLYYEINKQAPGKSPVGGTCPPVGVGGLIPGGGIGFLTRKEGLACDMLISLKMVTAAGSLVEASASKNQDLFWAQCGGGGGNFGIVVEYTLKLASVPTKVTRIQFGVDEKLADFLMYMQSVVVNKADPNISLAIFPDKDSIDVTLMYLGTIQEADKALVESGLAGPKFPFKKSWQKATYLSWIDFVVKEAGMMSVRKPADLENPEDYAMDRSFFQNKGFFVRPGKLLPKEAFEALISWMGRVAKEGKNDDAGFVELDLLGPRGAQAKIGSDKTGYAYRDALFVVQYGCEWEDPNKSKLYLRLVNELKMEMQKYVGPGPPAYINYLDAGQPTTSYYGNAWSKLKKVKGQYDPENYFRNPNSIPPS